MKKLFPVFITAIVLTVISCEKEYSLENSGDVTGSGQIIGVDCRITKIAYNDTSAAGAGIGAITALINSTDQVTNITKFDSLSLTIDFIATPVYSNDTVHINADEYFLVNAATKRINQLHALVDPTDPFSIQYEVNYFYDGAGYLINKFYTFTSNPGIPFYIVRYTYLGGKLTNMRGNEQIAGVDGDLITNADVSYFSNIIPKNFLYIFPDEESYPYFNQFYNFGQKPSNAVKDIKVRYFDPGNVVRDSTVSSFSNYIMSRDNYVLSVIMDGDDQISIPAAAGKLSFSYKCK